MGGGNVLVMKNFEAGIVENIEPESSAGFGDKFLFREEKRAHIQITPAFEVLIRENDESAMRSVDPGGMRKRLRILRANYALNAAPDCELHIQ